MWNLVKRRAFLILFASAIVATIAYALVVAMSFYSADVSSLPGDLHPEMRARMEFHAWETAHFGFWAVLITAFPYLLAVLLAGGLLISALRSKS